MQFQIMLNVIKKRNFKQHAKQSTYRFTSGWFTYICGPDQTTAFHGLGGSGESGNCPSIQFGYRLWHPSNEEINVRYFLTHSTLVSKLFFLAVQGSGALLSSSLEGALYKSP